MISFFLAKAAPRKHRSKSMVQYDRNVHISRPVRTQAHEEPIRRSQRVAVPVKLYNYGAVTCCVCNKCFRDDFSSEYYQEGVVCSVKCWKKAN